MSRRRSTGKIILLSAVLTVAFAGLFMRLLFLHLEFDKPFQKKIQSSQSVTRDINQRRGRILDRCGSIFAMDVRMFHVVLDPKEITGIDRDSKDANYLEQRNIQTNDCTQVISNYLAEHLRMDAQEIALQIEDRAHWKRGSRYYILKKYVTDETVDVIKAGLSDLKIPPNAIRFAESFKRRYPKDALMSHVVGYVNDNGDGCAGMELALNSKLKGELGKISYDVDGKGNEIYSTRNLIKEAVDGADVYLTLDQEIQHITENALNELFVKNRPIAAWAIVQRVETGEILAMASIPPYDLNAYGRADKDWMLNRAIGVSFEPGSTMKSITIASALNEKLVVPEEIIDCEAGRWYYLGKSLSEYRNHHYGKLSVADVLKKSSNIGTAKIALRLGEQRLDEYIRSFGFGQKLGCGLPGEEHGLFWPYKKWSKIDITRIGMGHSISVTAMQMVNAYSCLANGGRLMRPTVVRKVVAPDGTVLHNFTPECIGRPIRPEVAETMWRLMARVTGEGGTAPSARVDGYNVAGKTGTATKVNPNSRGYLSGHNIASFAGFIPAERPEIAIIVVADDPRGTNTGGAVSGPAFSKIADQTMRYLGIPPSESEEFYTGDTF
jgi:cell division protein FtsI (penicillin-binding protein 3)